MRPLLAVATGPLWRTLVPDAFAVAKSAGAEAIEILVTPDPDTQSPNALEKLATKHDLPITAVHAPLLLVTRRVYTRNPLEKIRRTIDLCKALDVKTIVLHPPYIWQVRYGLWAVHELEDELASSGCIVTMENMYPVHFGTRKLRFHRFGPLEALERFPYLTLDTSHLAVSGDDIVEAYRSLQDRVVHIHLSDNRGKGRDSHAPLGEGILPLDDFIHALDNPALRSVALEINPGPRAEDFTKLEKTLGENLDHVRGHLPART